MCAFIFSSSKIEVHVSVVSLKLTVYTGPSSHYSQLQFCVPEKLTYNGLNIIFPILPVIIFLTKHSVPTAHGVLTLDIRKVDLLGSQLHLVPFLMSLSFVFCESISPFL